MKSNSFIIVSLYKVSKFLDSHLFCSGEYIQGIHHYLIEKQKSLKKWFDMDE